MKHNYLSNIPLEEAVEKFLSCLKNVGTSYKTETVETRRANGRTVAKAVYAKRCSPHYCACAMDGIALKAGLTAGASESSPVLIKKEDFVFVDTGDPLPDGADCVVMIEEVTENSDGSVMLYSASAPWSHVRQIGEDVSAGDMIAPSFTRVTPSLIGAFLAGGVFELTVTKKPVFAIIPTGDEIVDAQSEVKSGDIPEYNSAVFSAMLSEWGAESEVYPITPDDPALLEAAVKKACEVCDGVIVIAGSSAGRDDYTSSVLKKLGKVLVHGLAIRPGKPAVLGCIGKVPFIGVPGYPVSGIIVMEKIVKAVVSLFTKMPVEDAEKISVTVSKRIPSSLKYHEFVRCRAAVVGNKTVAVPMGRAAGIVSDFAKASGIIEIEQNSEGVEGGERLEMTLLKSRGEIERCVCVIGSHDVMIDELSDILARGEKPFCVMSANTGSMGCITALRNKEAHLGGIHLLDSESGEYNKSYVKRYFPNGGVMLVKGVGRIQGFIVPKGNPKQLEAIEDLRRVSFVNRQRGAGTRILLDWLLKKHGISIDEIYGYTREEYTHTAVAAAVACGSADCGLGVYSAARTYDLDFVPLFNEEYDFLVSNEAFEQDGVKAFLAALKSEEFKERLKKLGGYDFKNAGEIIMEV